jgi:4'-phosphopantetheinyl transferase
MTLFRCTDLSVDHGAAALSRDRLACQRDVIHVVCARLDEPVAGAIDLLDDDERARAARFVFYRDRRRFVAAHAWTRLALASCLNRTPESLRFSIGGRGKPRLVDASPDVRFNLSHAGERALLAIALGQEVGVDIEEHRPIEVFELARRFFTPKEVRSIEALAASEQTCAFFRFWTRKEAFIKALGEGLSFPLDGFEVSVADGRVSQFLRAYTAAAKPLGCWRIVSLGAEPGYSAALAATAAPWRVVRWDAIGQHPVRPQ